MPTKGTERTWEKKPEVREKLSDMPLDQLLQRYRKLFDEGYADVKVITGEELLKQLLQLDAQMDEKSKKLGIERPKEKGRSIQEKKMMALLLMDEQLEPVRQEIIQRVYHAKGSLSMTPLQRDMAQREAIAQIQKSLAGEEFTDVILLADLLNEEFKRQQDLMLEEWKDPSRRSELEANRDAIQSGIRQKGKEKTPTEQESAFMTYLYQELQKSGDVSNQLGSGEIKSLEDFVKSKAIRDGYEQFLDGRQLLKDLFLSPQPGWYENLCRLVNIEKRLHAYEITELRDLEELKKNPRFQKIIDGQQKDGWRRFVPFFTNNRSEMVSDSLQVFNDPNRFGSLADFGFNSIHGDFRNFWAASKIANFFEPMGKWASSWVPTPGNAFNTNLDKVMWGGVKVWTSTGFLLNALPGGVLTGRHVYDAFWKLVKGDISGAATEIFGWSENHGEALLSDLAHYLTNGQSLTAIGMAWFGTSDPERIAKEINSWTADKWKVFLDWFQEWKDRDRKAFFAVDKFKVEAGDLWNKGPEGLREFLWKPPKDFNTDQMLSWRGPEWIELRKWPNVSEKDVQEIEEHFATLKKLDLETKDFFTKNKFPPKTMQRAPGEHRSLQAFDDFVVRYHAEQLKKPAGSPYDPISFDELGSMKLVNKGVLEGFVKTSASFKDLSKQKLPIPKELGDKIMKRAEWVEKRGKKRHF